MIKGEPVDRDLSRDVGAARERPAQPPTSARVDFANRSGHHVLVFGWILGLAKQVARAEIRYGDVVLDLKALAVPIPRPDVTQHFLMDADPGDDRHGFYLLVELPEVRARTSYLRLAVVQHSGERSESVWPMSAGEAPLAAFFQENRGTLVWLSRNLEPAAAERLRALTSSSQVPLMGMPWAAENSAELRFAVDTCCILGPQILVLIGRLEFHPRHLTTATVQLGDYRLDVLREIVLAVAQDHPEVENLPSETTAGLAFSVVVELPETLPEPVPVAEAMIEVAGAAGRAKARRVIRADSAAARAEFKSQLNLLDVNSALVLLERIAALLGDPADASLSEWLAAVYSPLVERLPVSLAANDADIFLHCDRATRIGDVGLFLEGWFHAPESADCRLSCHCGFQKVAIDARWVRTPRKDVTEHLESLGAAPSDHDHGFTCFVSLDVRRAPCFLSVITKGGRVCRMRLPPLHPVPALQAIRAVLTSFPVSNRSLGVLFDEHVGPAVQKAWTQRRKSTQPVSIHRYGQSPANPKVSVIVPLYGRHDFAEYQLALFADDPDFQSLELMYFVDDPSIFDEFRFRCDDLYQIYQVPFTLAFAGVNLGFAGANNRAAEAAGGRHLLLMNSDVFPKSPGWVAKLLTKYAALDKPGMLGVKLLYEDGSVQHAGMAFRRHAPWNNWWVNDHPHKGQSPLGLSGLRKVDAVTAACALVSADLYRELGGLSEHYIIGDFEDSDFCLRAAARGRRHWVSLDIELYHLERQSQARVGDEHWRTNLTLYNCWQHSQRWGAHLEKRTR